ncbi:hypothetical protein PHMEG_00017010 [Phytophthora megakarya]|uniref:Uncharacterized protein n=1 Tax=Phytophthora megakarya TaxID=4795 RepID=A0A225VYY1_9STRA|nr:hypothetical protein PHMEG_00017010 [Phytophthora megakarya]
MTGDVAAAFRNVSIHSDSVRWFGGLIEEEQVLILELCCPFGWTGSPGYYEIVGGAIAYAHGVHTNVAYPSGFFNYHWVDDHVNVTTDIGSNCADLERSMWFAMTAVLGADAVNEDKFTSWSSTQKVLELQFDCIQLSVSMPTDKIENSRRLVSAAFHTHRLSRQSYRSLLGSVGHVATCVRPARPSLQRLRQRELQLHRFEFVTVSTDMKADLRWWWLALHSPHTNEVPMVFFNDLPPTPDVIVETDASDFGLCALDTTNEYALTYRFTPAELRLVATFKATGGNGFDINFRELLSCAPLYRLSGRRWSERLRTTSRPLHVHFRIDNISAVTWQNKLASRNPRAQVLNRLLCWWGMKYSLRFSASHIPDVDNVRADAGSRLASHVSFANPFTWFPQPGYQRPDNALATYLRPHSVADSTFAKYTSALKRWQAWTSRQGLSPWLTGLSLHDCVHHICNFITDGFQHGFGSGQPVKGPTILATLHGIKHFFAAGGNTFSIDHPHIHMLLKGIRRFDPPRRRNPPLSIRLLEARFHSLDLLYPETQVLWGVLCLAFFFLLRRFEIVTFLWSTHKEIAHAIPGSHTLCASRCAARRRISVAQLR